MRLHKPEMESEGDKKNKQRGIPPRADNRGQFKKIKEQNEYIWKST